MFTDQAEVDVKKRPFALISPHAGYIFSGPTAGYSYKFLKKYKYKTVIVIGPSHHVQLAGASIMDVTHYRTPLGTVPVSKKVKTLLKQKGFTSMPSAHGREHSVEVQIPFIQHLNKNAEIIPIVVGQGHEKEIANALIKIIDNQTLVVASSDLSHFHEYDEANRRDKKCIKVIESLDTESMRRQEACGRFPIIILMHIARQKAWHPVLLDFRNSGDTAGDRSRVVGYASFAFFPGKKKEIKTMPQKIDDVDKEDRKFLLGLARRTVVQYLENGTKPKPDVEKMSNTLKEDRGAFVTLHKKGALRGCIGFITPRGPLYKAVIENAVNAAVNDPRFPKVTADEVKNLHIEISVLTQPKKLEFDTPEDLMNKLRPLVDGVILTFPGYRQSTFLPQVWEQLKDREAFLSHLSAKAGMSSSAWREPGMEVQTYQAQVFAE
jgi:AmmeMemoRadiSam system protein B/AmmeMemoRadiSam system protein A